MQSILNVDGFPTSGYRTIPFVMTELESFDINTELDFQIANLLSDHLKGRICLNKSLHSFIYSSLHLIIRVRELLSVKHSLRALLPLISTSRDTLFLPTYEANFENPDPAIISMSAFSH